MRVSLGILLVVFSGGASAQHLGTLFHTPKEREILERLRRGEPVERARLAPDADPVVTGYVKRSDGKSTLFIDKQPYAARDAQDQRLLEPRIIERYEPMPKPQAPPPPQETGLDVKGIMSKIESAESALRGKEKKEE